MFFQGAMLILESRVIMFIVKSIWKEQNSTNLIYYYDTQFAGKTCNHPKVIQLLGH